MKSMLEAFCLVLLTYIEHIIIYRKHITTSAKLISGKFNGITQSEKIL